MRAISLELGFALDILSGEKTVEHRSFSAKLGPLALASTAATSPGKQGRLICVAEIVKVQGNRESGFAWYLAKVRATEQKPISGKQGWYSIDDSLIAYLETKPAKSRPALPAPTPVLALPDLPLPAAGFQAKALAFVERAIQDRQKLESALTSARQRLAKYR